MSSREPADQIARIYEGDASSLSPKEDLGEDVETLKTSPWVDAMFEAMQARRTGSLYRSFVDLPVQMTDLYEQLETRRFEMEEAPDEDLTYHIVPHKRLVDFARRYEDAFRALERAREPLRLISRTPISGPVPEPFAEGQAPEPTAQIAPQLVSPPSSAQVLAWGFLRWGVLAGWVLVLGSILVALGSWAIMLATIYLGVAVFCFADYAGYRVAGTRWFLPPRAALIGVYGFIGLSITMIVSEF